MHTVHVEDVAGALWACAVWINRQGREQAIALAGEKIPFHNEKSKAKEVDGVASPDAQPVAPLFNLVDDSETTLAKGGSMITEYFGTTFEFYSNFETTIAKVRCLISLGAASGHADCASAQARRLGGGNQRAPRGDMDGDAPAFKPADHAHAIDRIHGQVCIIKTQACIQQWEDQKRGWLSTEAPIVRSRGAERGRRKVEGGGDVAAARGAVMQGSHEYLTEVLFLGLLVSAFFFPLAIHVLAPTCCLCCYACCTADQYCCLIS